MTWAPWILSLCGILIAVTGLGMFLAAFGLLFWFAPQLMLAGLLTMVVGTLLVGLPFTLDWAETP